MTKGGRFTRMGVLLPLFLMVLNTVYLSAAFDIRTQFSSGEGIGPRTIPILVSLAMYVALLVVLAGELRNTDEPEEAEGALLRPLLVALATGGYIFLFRPLGYWIDTGLYVAALFAIFQFELRRPHFFAFYLALVCLIFYGLFAGVFGVRLPQLPGGLG